MLEQAMNNLKRSIKYNFWFMLLLIPCAFLNKQTKGIILSNPSHRQLASDKQEIVTWNPPMNLKPEAEKFEERMAVKMIVKVLLKSEIFIVLN